MKTIHLTVAVAVCTLIGSSTYLGAEDARTTESTNSKTAKQYEADNTGKNVRDRNEANVTAEGQGSSQKDRELAAAIRRSVVEDDSLSTNAHNIKIIVDQGTVTLKGPVNSAQERTSIESKAKQVAGTKTIKNLLEIVDARAG